jgi:streptogramin lyase
MRRGAAVAVAVVCAAVLGLAALAGADPPTGTVAPYAIPALTGPIGVTGGPQDIATGSDGSLWFTESASDYEIGQLGTVAESGAVEEPTGATGLLGAQVIAPGTAGTMWFTQDDRVHTIGELAITTETVTPSPVLDEKSEDTYSFAGVAVDPLGDVWATVSGNHGSIVELSPPYDAWTQPKGPTGQTGPTGFDDLVNNDDVSVQPGSIVLGPDANMWFTENTLSPDGADQIGTFSPTASPSPPTLYPSASSPLLLAGRLGNIVVGPDGNLWVGLLYERPPVEVSAPLDAAGTGASYVLRITPSGAISEYQLPTGSDADPDVLAVGPDGRLWMPDATDGGLTAISTDGTFASYPGLLPTGADITAMVADPGGADALWLTDQASNAIYRVALQPPATNTPPTTTTTTTTSTTAATTSPPATVLSVTLAAVSAVTKSGATLSGTIVALPGPQTPVTYEFQYGTATAYGSQTAAATATATPAGASVSTTLSGLTPYTTYHYRHVASDCAAAS